MKTLFILTFFLFPMVGKAQVNQYTKPGTHEYRSTYVPQHVPLPLDLIERALQAKQAQYNQSIQDCQNQAIELYKAKDTAPEIGNGKHNATLIGRGTCTETVVIVDNGKVFSIPLANGQYLKDFTISTTIDGCKSKIGYRDQETGVTQYLDVLFLEDLYRE